MSNDDPKSQPANPFAPGGAPLLNQSAQSFNPFAPQSKAAPGLVPNSALNPFGTQPATNDANANPFAAKTPTPAPTADASAAFNPFAAQQSAAASPLAQGLNNPLIKPAEPAPASLGSMNPFDQQVAPAPAPVAPAQMVAPASIAANRLADQSNFNVFDAPSQVATNADPFANIPSAVAAPEPASTSDSVQNDFDSYSYQEAEQIRGLAPLEFAPAEIEVQDLSELPDIAAGYVKKSSLKMMIGGVAAATLLFGFLIGVMMKERRTHNLRVDAWNHINQELTEPLVLVDKLDKQIKEQLTEISTKRRIPWEMNENLPQKIALVPSDILAPLVPLEPTAMRELSELVLETNLLFQAVQEHRSETARLVADFKSQGQTKAFSSYETYAVDVSEFLARCSKKGRLSCQHPAKPGVRVVAINKLTERQSEVIVRYDNKMVKLDTESLIPIQRKDVLGLVNPTTLYVDKLGQLSKSLERVKAIRDSFQDKLNTKTQIQKVIAL